MIIGTYCLFLYETSHRIARRDAFEAVDDKQPMDATTLNIFFPMMIRTRTAALLMLLAAGCSGGPKRGEPMPTVQVQQVEAYGEAQQLEFPGRVKPAQEVNLAFQVAGTLQRFHVAEGAAVRQGQVIATLDPRDYRLQAEAVEAEYRQVKAQAERVVALHAEGAATDAEYDRARYGLQQMEAKYNNSRNQLADTELRAPFDGSVQRHLLDRGTVVGAGMPVVSLVSNGAPEVEINIPGAEYIRREEFAGFAGVFEFWPDRKIPLTLLSVSPKANANQLYTVRLGLPAHTDPMPAPGMNTMVEIAVRPTDDRRTGIPATALFADAGQSCVWIFDPADSTVTKRAVQVQTLHSDGTAVVGAELTPGERIVTAGVHHLHEGQRVAPMAEVSPTNVGGLL